MAFSKDTVSAGSASPGKSLQQGLQAEMETLRRVIDSLAEGVIIADNKGRFILFNPVAEKILGIGLQDVDSSEWTQVYGCYFPDRLTPYPSDQLPLAKAIKGEVINNEIIFIKNAMRPDGIYINISASPLKDDKERIVGGTVILRDITENILAEKIKEQSEMRINAQFRGFPIPTYVWQRRGDDFILVDYNDAAHTITNGNAKKYIGKQFSKIFQDSPHIRKDLVRAFEEKSIVAREMPHRMKTTGEDKQFVFTYVYVPTNLMMMHMQDITELKQTEKELRKLSNAVEQTADSIIITNKKGTIEYVNQGFVETTGYSRDDAIGKTPNFLKSGKHDKKFYDNLWKTIRSGQTFRGTIINKKKNGELYWSQQSITPMKDEYDKISHYVSVLKDITEFKKRQEQEFNLRVAQEVQTNFYKNGMTIPGFDLAGETYSAEETNGDYFDFIRFNDGACGLVIGDVSGHGVGSALIMAETRAYLRAFAKKESDPGVLLTLLNNELVADLDETHFVTMILARIDPKKKVLHYASAAHEPAYLLNGEGRIKNKLESMDIPLGFIQDTQYQKSEAIRLHAGDIAVFLTDGIIEAHIDEARPFGVERALETVVKYRKQTSRQIIHNLYQRVKTYTPDLPQQDDITSIVFKVNGKSK
ncbi:SpoIIE family protein phosphatase [candidate division KSB1 bacterium]|nr:SpoIIE family protein phosphatase [candidate division KSB1 bacterium]